MKIEQETWVGMGKTQLEQKNTAAKSAAFSSMVQTQREKLQYSQLEKLMTEIDHAGERLARSRTFKDLSKYKSMVKKFIKETVNFGMNLKQYHTWNEYGEGRKLSIVETIDQHLVDLTEDMLKNDQSSIDILGKIGEVKGLLINLYT